MYQNSDLRIFSGNAHSALASDVCQYLDIEPGAVEVFQFSNENIFVRFRENIRGRDVFLMQPFSTPVNHSIMELLIMIDAAKRASAGRITAVVPYYAYGRTDKKDQPRVPITGRLLADLIQVAGAERVLTVDLHAGQIQGFFNMPVDELTATPLIADYFLDTDSAGIVVAPDVGSTKRARDVAERWGEPLAIVEKRRFGNSGRSESVTVIGDVKGRKVILVDDEVDTGGSLVSAAETLLNQGATSVSAAVTHPVLSGGPGGPLQNSVLDQIVVSDTLPIHNKHTDGMNIKVVSVAPLLGEAIKRIHYNRSVGEMFEA